MKILKYLLFIVLGLVAIGLIVAAFLPKTFHVEGRATINRPISDVYNYVKQLKTQEVYSVWFKMDPKIKKEYAGTDGTVGASIVWYSDEVGDGKQVITGLKENERVDIDLYLMSTEGTPNKHYYEMKSQGDQTTDVIIGLDGHTPYPMNIMSLFFDMGKYFQENADNLKAVLEK